MERNFNTCGDDNFDWSLYEGGYNGLSLVENKNIKNVRKGDKIFSHEQYAQSYYDALNSYSRANYTSPKDDVIGAVYNVSGIKAISDHEVLVNSDNGMTSVIDLNKEHQFLNTLPCKTPKDFVESLKDGMFKKELLSQNLVMKVNQSRRISLWEGLKSKVESEFMEQLTNPDAPQYAYPAKILRVNSNQLVNAGGFTVDVNGVECFLPGSHAASGPVSDFDAMVGKTLMVCVINYSQKTNNFVVSYKKYLEKVLPSKIENELAPGMMVQVKVTGVSKNGLFLSIKDNCGEYVFTALLHRSCMSHEFEADFNEKNFIVGDEFMAYVHRIDISDDGSYRIVIGDKAPDVESNKDDVED